MLIVNSSTPTGVTDISGNLLDGNGDGKPGDNDVAILRGFGLDKPGVPFNKLIRRPAPRAAALVSCRAHEKCPSRAGGAGLAQADGAGQPRHALVSQLGRGARAQLSQEG